MDDKWELSFCGLNCAVCDMYRASHGDSSLHEEVVKWFQENIDPKITYVSCEKCRGPSDKCWTDDCKFRECATEKGHEYCFQCDEFVCDKLDAFAKDGAPHHARTVENLKEMKKRGLDAWIKSQKEVKFCP